MSSKPTSRDDGLTHLDERGRAHMVDVGDKAVTRREAVATARVRMRAETLEVLRSGVAAKGDVLAVSRVAAIQAAKRTWELIPLCHQIALSSCEVSFEFDEPGAALCVEARVLAQDRTGAEMEALTAVSVGALCVYDMLKAIDRAMVIEAVQLESKRGGRTGDYHRDG